MVQKTSKYYTTFFDAVLILRRTERHMIKKVYWPSHKILVILDRFYRNLNFLDIFLKSTHIPNLIKIRPVGSDFYHVDRRTEGQKETQTRRS
jgi:hypothetical protein